MMIRLALLTCLLLTAAVQAADPSTQTAANVSELQAKLDLANARIAELELELAALRATPAPVADAVTPAAQPTVVVVTPIRDDGTSLSLKRAVASHVKAGMTPAAVIATLGEPKEKQRANDRDVYIYKRADVGRMNHGSFAPGAKYTVTLMFDAAGKLEKIETADR